MTKPSADPNDGTLFVAVHAERDPLLFSLYGPVASPWDASAEVDADLWWAWGWIAEDQCWGSPGYLSREHWAQNGWTFVPFADASVAFLQAPVLPE